MKRILSALLVAVMLFGACAGLIPAAATRAFAAPADTSTGNYLEATDAAISTTYESLDDKIQNGGMQLLLALDANNNTYQLYCNPFTGEVIYRNKTTGESLTTNPYDMGGNEAISSTVKERLMSQVVVSYKGTDGNLKTMYSYTEAARRGQILVKNIRDGIRVQYTIGRENAMYLIPYWITEARFQEKIMGPLNAYVDEIAELHGEDSDEWKNADFLRNRIKLTWVLQDPNDPTLSEKLRDKIQSLYPITRKTDPATGEKYAIRTIPADLTDMQKASFETIIRTFCTEYTYEDIEKDNALTGYVSKDETPPLFKVSIEYTINKEDGSLDIRVPANGILYDETMFTLESVSTLNYLGAGRMQTTTYDSYFAENSVQGKVYGGASGDEILYDGYAFYPDGSGTLFQFSDLYTETNKVSVTWDSKVYGQDYAYYTIGGKSQEKINMPVYGVISTTDVKEIPTGKLDASGREIYDLQPVQTGFLAILEEGEALTNLTVAFGATRHNYASVYPSYLPRPKDTYDLADSVSVSGNTEWTVVADRKYTGSYRTRVILLSDMPGAAYDPSWVGMASAYREFLKKHDILTRLTDADVEDMIPLYIEAFGAYETTKQILSMPVDVKVPLTTFENIGEIYTDLSENAGITNINFKLTGFANGGMLSRYPAKLKWEKAVGGKRDFRDLVAMAEEKGFGVYPEFDFSYISNEGSFDGVSLKGLGARTVDNRYCSKQIYDAVYQQFTNFFDMCVATNLIGEYYAKFSKKLSAFQEYGTFGLSVGSLGSDLNSNFDEDNPINREEAKDDIVDLISSMEDTYGSLMVNGGNSYILKYADHILDMPLEGSNYRYASASVPFMAMILHGYINYTGAALNTSGDTDYAVLKSIENGAYPYFLLSYNTENAMLLKKDETLNKYYSIRYDIWRWSDADEKTGDGTIVEQYRLLNQALSDLQTAELVDHEFIQGERVLRESEIAAQKVALADAVLAAVQVEIDASYERILDTLAGNLKYYNVLSTYDAQLRAIATGSGIATVKKRNIKNLLAEAIPSEAVRDKIADTYIAKNGDGLSDYKVERGLYVKTNIDFDKLWVKVVEGVKGRFTEAELDALRTDVMALALAKGGVYTADGVTAVSAKLAAIVGTTYTPADLSVLYRLAYTNLTDDEIKAEAATAFSTALDDAKVAEALALVKAVKAEASLYTAIRVVAGRDLTDKDIETFNILIYTGLDLTAATARAKADMALTDAQAADVAAMALAARARAEVLAVVKTANVEFNFNETDSSATDGTGYQDTDFTLEDERLVLVTYRKADGTEVKFILNYNIFSVRVKLGTETYTLDPYGFVRIGANK